VAEECVDLVEDEEDDGTPSVGSVGRMIPVDEGEELVGEISITLANDVELVDMIEIDVVDVVLVLVVVVLEVVDSMGIIVVDVDGGFGGAVVLV
jgi:hypothetical protein